jgi:hypothetical protein
MKEIRKYEERNVLTSNMVGIMPGLDFFATTLNQPQEEDARTKLISVNGCYEGHVIPASWPKGKQLGLVIRIDVELGSSDYPAMNRLSGDFFKEHHGSLIPGGARTNNSISSARIYQESWIVDKPEVKWTPYGAIITGIIRFWDTNTSRLEKSIKVITNRSESDQSEIATVTFVDVSGKNTIYKCIKKSNWLRNITLEIDVCKSVNNKPILQVDDSHDHGNKPEKFPQQILTFIEKSYGKAGIGLTIRSDHTIIDDTASEFSTWSNAELHHAMEVNFSQFKRSWPRWELWGLFAGKHDNAGKAGIMFDSEKKYRGSGKPPYRQGFAVFRCHDLFKKLPAKVPTTEDEARALRQFLYTWVHEVGHAFNMKHSWEKGSLKTLSWMNYPHYYPDGGIEFWKKFRFQFDEKELIHLRHGNRLAVIMGGEALSSGSNFADTSETFPQVEGQLPIELLLKSKGYFEFMEPVKIEFRLRNLLLNVPIDMDLRLAPEDGNVTIHIRRPDGRMIEYKPIISNFANRNIQTLQPQNMSIEGEDRYSQEVFLSYGKSGFYFDEPGEYLLCAVYHGAADIFLSSNIHRIRIGRPFSKEEDRIAQDFFSYETGMSLYLNGSRSSFLSNGMDLLESVIASSGTKESLLSAKLATICANSISRPFFQIEDGTLKKIHAPNLDKAIDITKPALSVYKKQKSKSLNITYHELVKNRAKWLAALGRKQEAKDEINDLHNALSNRGVNKPVLDEIKLFEKKL